MSQFVTEVTGTTRYRKAEEEGTAWEIASLRMRSTTLAAENEALRGHVQQLQDELARLERNVPASRLPASSVAVLDTPELRVQLEGQGSLLKEVSSAARELATENEALNYEVMGLRDANRKVGSDLATMKDRLKTLEELYLRATRMCQGSAAANAADAQLDAIDSIVTSAMPQGSADACTSDLDLTEPDSIVPALQQIAALRRERDLLKTQVKKAEAALEQATREKQDLAQALASERRRALGKGGQARLGNLAQRIQILAEQVRQKDEALAEKVAYVAKLEWRLLCQHKALEGGLARKPPLGQPRETGAKKALPRKPQLAGIRVDANARQPVSAAVRHPQTGGEQPKRPALEPEALPVRGNGQHGASALQLIEEAGSDMHGSHGAAAAAAQHSGIASGASRPSRPSARKSLFSTPEPARSGQRPGSPPGRGQDAVHLPTPQVAPTPTYISRSLQQESALSPGAVDSRHPAVQSSPAVSEMVYELRPAAARSKPFPVHLVDDLEGYASSNASLLHSNVAAMDSQQIPDSGERLSTTRAFDAAAWQHDRGSGVGGGAASRPVGSLEGEASSLPDYSGFSSEMRAAAKATAAALLADATWHGNSAPTHAPGNENTSAQEGSVGYPGREQPEWGTALSSPAEEGFQSPEGHDGETVPLISLDELEAQIAALNTTLEAEEDAAPGGKVTLEVHQSSLVLPKRRRSQQTLSTCLGVAASPTKR